MHSTLPLLRETLFPPLHRLGIGTLQVSLGYRCNQRCLHCHVNAGPTRSEMMDGETLALIPRVLAARGIRRLDLTGGAPELHGGFRDLVRESVAMGVEVIDRCNLTILFEPGQEDLAEFLARHRVGIIASLPCYLSANVDHQRGNGVFARSIPALQRLNALGYGREGTGLSLDLVYNPQGPSLPPPQAVLEADYRRELGERHGIVFNRLYALANMPINRFGSMLISQGRFAEYMELLREGFTPRNLDRVMCRTMVSVDWRGGLYDCDFNQQLGLPIPGDGGPHLRDLLDTGLDGRPICVADHCYGCTAGQGSSCSGAL